LKGLIKSSIREVLEEYFEKNNIVKNKEIPMETEIWLSGEEAKKLLGIKSKSKMQQMRNHGKIIFSQHGRIIKYSRKSLLEFLSRNVINIHSPFQG
jgi:hypothetical protein